MQFQGITVGVAHGVSDLGNPVHQPSVAIRHFGKPTAGLTIPSREETDKIISDLIDARDKCFPEPVKSVEQQQAECCDNGAKTDPVAPDAREIVKAGSRCLTIGSGWGTSLGMLGHVLNPVLVRVKLDGGRLIDVRANDGIAVSAPIRAIRSGVDTNDNIVRVVSVDSFHHKTC
jgi:hypothetical protein